jgi:hypothetical protein
MMASSSRGRGRSGAEVSCSSGARGDLAALALLVASTVQAQGGCPGGTGLSYNASFPDGVCESCPPGKQSPAGETLCLYCRESLQPNATQDGCDCAPLHFSPWAATAQQPDVGCTPCASLHVSRLADMRKAAEANDPSILHAFIAEDRKGDDFVVPCKGPSVGVQQLVADKGDVDVVKSLCDTFDHTECAGGGKGDAAVCPNTGVWMMPQAFDRIARNASALPPERTSEQSALFMLQECMPPRGGGPSRCQHWSRCVEAADQGEEAEDPWTPYVSDEEFAHWLLEGKHSQETCRTVLGRLGPAAGGIDNFDDPWDHVRSDGTNCCAPDFHGVMCDTCIEPLMKINERCVRCSGEVVRALPLVQLSAEIRACRCVEHLTDIRRSVLRRPSPLWVARRVFATQNTPLCNAEPGISLLCLLVHLLCPIELTLWKLSMSGVEVRKLEQDVLGRVPSDLLYSVHHAQSNDDI